MVVSVPVKVAEGPGATAALTVKASVVDLLRTPEVPLTVSV